MTGSKGLEEVAAVSRLSFLVACIGAALLSSVARATVVVDHQPHPFGGPAADTDFINRYGQRTWQLLADVFTLSSRAVVREVRWWGFYEPDVLPTSETMRIRFYDSRPSDGLPGTMLFEELVANPARAWTGRWVIHLINSREYLFSHSLSAPQPFYPSALYWIEIVQLGDVNSHYRWEFALAEQNGLAYANAVTNGWAHAAFDGDLAFQLVVPEPTSLGLLTLSLLWVARRRLGCAVRPAA